jgi:3-methyladenine DNA glycosylase AlkD
MMRQRGNRHQHREPLHIYHLKVSVTANDILKKLRALGSEENRTGMARFGINSANAFGVPMTPVRQLARELKSDHQLAHDLWATGNREARILAALIADPMQLTRAEMDRWVRDFDSWDICDNAAIHLFRKSPHAWEQALKWARMKPEFTRRAGFAMLAVHDKHAPDETFLEVLPLIEEFAIDDRNFVKKAVNWTLRQIGKRNPELRNAAIEVAIRLAEARKPSARWIGRDALRELSASSRTQRSSRPSGTPSKRTAPGTRDRSKTPTRRPSLD